MLGETPIGLNVSVVAREALLLGCEHVPLVPLLRVSNSKEIEPCREFYRGKEWGEYRAL